MQRTDIESVTMQRPLVQVVVDKGAMTILETNERINNHDRNTTDLLVKSNLLQEFAIIFLFFITLCCCKLVYSQTFRHGYIARVLLGQKKNILNTCSE